MSAKRKCLWPAGDQRMQQYHDLEWGRPVHDDQKLFELLVLESFQAGLSWRTILHRRDAFRAAFHDFDPHIVRLFAESDLERLLQDASIIRHRKKIESAIVNAQAVCDIQQAFGSFASFIWDLVGGAIIDRHPQEPEDVPSTSAESDRVSKVLKARGFRFVGSTTCYAFMQAAGMVNDHLPGCR